MTAIAHSRQAAGIIVCAVAIALAAYYWLAVSGSEPRLQSRAGSEQTVLIIGDSYVAGSVANDGPEWPDLLHGEYGWTIVQNAVGGVGYLRTSPDIATDGPYGTQLRSFHGVDPDVVVLEGGLNDIIFPVNEMEAAMRELAQDVASQWPDAQLVMLSQAAPTPAMLSVDHVAAAEAVAREEGLRYIDVSRWFLDGEPEWIGSDGLHPSNEGHQMLAERLGPVIEQELQR